MARLYIEIEGQTISGKPAFWLMADEDTTNHWGDEIAQGEKFSGGFFGSAEDAKKWAEEHGHTIVEDPS